MGVFTIIINVKSTEKLQSFCDTFFHLTLLAINTGSRSQRTSFNSGDHLAVKRPVTITSSASKKELKDFDNQNPTTNIAVMNSSCPLQPGQHICYSETKDRNPIRLS